MRKVSKRQAKSNRLVSQAKSRFLERFREEHGYYFCAGCGTTSGRIDVSHLVPIGHKKSLEATESNLTLHCSSCHRAWENQTKEVTQLKDYEQNLKRVKSLDEDYYNQIKNKWQIQSGQNTTT